MPVYNGAETIHKAIDSALSQTYSNFELIISDNFSDDSTQLICQEYARLDNRIRYYRQSENIGATANFKFVLDKAVGKYFMWAAADDYRTPDFIYENLRFLEENPSYVASTSPNIAEGRELSLINMVNFCLHGSVADRFQQFFKNCWVSNGIFYSLIRAHELRGCELVGQSFLAADWAIDLYLASRGNIHRVKQGMIVLGVNGISSQRSAYRVFRNKPIEIFIPFYRLSCYVFKLSKGFTLFEKFYLLRVLVALNFKAVYDQTYSFLYQFYCSYLKPLK